VGVDAPDPFPSIRDPVPIAQDAGWASEPFWTGADKIFRTGIRFFDNPARSESLYRPCYAAIMKQNNYVMGVLKFRYIRRYIGMSEAS